MALAGIDATLLDHVIVGEGYYSFADSGFIARVKPKFDEYLKLEVV